MLWVGGDKDLADGALDLTPHPHIEQNLTAAQRASTSAEAGRGGSRRHKRREPRDSYENPVVNDRDAVAARFPPATSEPHVRELFGVLRRHAKMVVAIAVLGTVLASVVGLTIPPKYTATVHLMVEPQPTSFGMGRAISPLDEAVDTHVTLLGSRTHLRRVAEGLTQDPAPSEAMNGTNQSPVPTEGGARWLNQLESRLGTWVGALSARLILSGEWLNEVTHRVRIWIGAFDRNGTEGVASVEEMERGIRVNQERRSRIITLAYTSKGRENAASIANLIAQVYINDLLEQKRAHASAESSRLEERIATAKVDSDDARNDLQKAIQQRLGAESDASSRGTDAGLHLRQLERRAATSAQRYSNLLRRQKEMHDQQETVTPGIEILSFASVPERPSSHNPVLFIFPALIVFAIFGGLLAVVLEQFDRGLRRDRDIESALGIPCIGLVPQIAGRRKRRRPHRYLLKEPFSAYAEAIRSIVSALHLKPASRASRVVFITSSARGEGKTTLAVSLATYATLIGRRAVLIDLDFRHSSMSEVLGGHAERGVPDFLVGDCILDDAIRHAPDSNLDYLPMTRCRADPVELVSSEDVRRLLRELRKRYDCILIDGSPLLAATEAHLLASLADKVLFVVKWGSTRRELAQSALNLLLSRGTSADKCFGSVVAVISQVDLKKHARYRYGDVGEYLVKQS